MRITIINQHVGGTLGGSEIQCDLLARGLTERGYSITYVAPANGPVRFITPYEVRVVCEPTGILNAVLESWPDVVYWRYNLHQFRATAAGLRRARVPVVFAASHINDVLPWVWHLPSKGGVAKLRQLVRRRWNRAGFRHVQALTTNNRDLLSLSPVADAHYIPNGMSEEAVPFHWPRPYVAWVANIKPAKRPEMFVEATRALAEHGIDGLMVGGMQSNGYDWLSDPNRIPSNFHYLGPRGLAEVNGLLAGSRLLAHTCQPEGFPNIFIQAWLQCRPSVSLEFDPCGYIEEQGLGAVAGGDIDTFIEQVVSWATQPERANRVGQRAQAFARDTFSVATMVSRVEKVLEEAVTRSARGKGAR